MQCPLNDIVITKDRTYASDHFQFSTIELEDKFYFHYTNKISDSYIVTNIAIASGDKICKLIEEAKDYFLAA